MGILSDNPITITKGAEWNSMVRMVRIENRHDIYKVLDTIADQCETIGEKMQERQCVRADYCVISIGSKRWDGRRMLSLQLQAPNDNNASGWDRFQIIDIELHDRGYRFKYYTHNRRKIDNTLNSRQFEDIYRIPVEIFNDIKWIINGKDDQR